MFRRRFQTRVFVRSHDIRSDFNSSCGFIEQVVCLCDLVMSMPFVLRESLLQSMDRGTRLPTGGPCYAMPRQASLGRDEPSDVGIPGRLSWQCWRKLETIT
jgi:hypothetical protein